MKRLAAVCLAGLALALPSSAQDSCSTLAISTAVDPVRPYQTVTIAVDGSLPGAPVYLVAGPALGETTINLHTLGVLVLDLESPFTTTLLGAADTNGSLSRSVTLPSDLGLVLHAQAVGVRIARNAGGKPKAEFCKSNVASFEL